MIYEFTVSDNEGRPIDGFTITTDRTPTGYHLTRIVDDIRDVTAGMVPGEVIDPDDGPTCNVYKMAAHLPTPPPGALA